MIALLLYCGGVVPLFVGVLLFYRVVVVLFNNSGVAGNLFRCFVGLMCCCFVVLSMCCVCLVSCGVVLFCCGDVLLLCCDVVLLC